MSHAVEVDLESIHGRVLSAFSHDLRTPIASIRGFSEFLKGGGKGKVSEAQAEVIQIVMQEVDHLNGLVQDIVDYAWIGTGRFQLIRRLVCWEDLLQQVLPRIGLAAKLIKAEFRAVFAKIDTLLWVDPIRIRQVLFNLLKSCLQRTGSGGQVILKVHTQAEHLHIQAEDDGPSLEEETLKRFFDWADPRMADTASGKGGLGLLITQQVVQAHGGTLTIDRRPGDRGTRFQLLLPFGHPPAWEERRPAFDPMYLSSR